MKNTTTNLAQTTPRTLTEDEIDLMSEEQLRTHLSSLGHDPDKQLAIFSSAIGSMKCQAALMKAAKIEPEVKEDARSVDLFPMPKFDKMAYAHHLVSAGRGQWMPSDDSANATTAADLFGKQKWEKTIFFPVRGDSMTPSGIHDGDSILVELGCEAKDGDIVLVHTAEHGEMVKLLRVDRDGAWLESSNTSYPPIRLGGPETFSIQGIVRGRAGPLP
jgi:hypothetical protein